MGVSSSLCGVGGLVMGLLVCTVVVLVPAATTAASVAGDGRTTMEMKPDGEELSRRTSADDPCGGVCESLGRSCVVATKGLAFCVNCSGILRLTSSGTERFAECCNYNEDKMRCGQALSGTPQGKCLRSENLFVRAPVPKPAFFRRSSGNACGKPWGFRDNGMGCRIERRRNGKVKCINYDGTEQQPSGCITRIVQMGDNIDEESEEKYEVLIISIAMSAGGSRVAIGALRNNSGYVRVFEIQGSEKWVQVGENIDGESIGDISGGSVAMSADGNRVAIGASGNDGNGRESGHVRVFEMRGGEGWVQLGKDIDGESARDYSGHSVAMSADGIRVAIGARMADGNGRFSGHVRVFEMQGSEEWVQVGEDIDGEVASDGLGEAVAMSADGSRVAIGAPYHFGNALRSGYVRVFEMRDSEGWVQLGEDIDGESEQDQSGTSVAISADGNRLAIGARLNSGNGPQSGQVRVFEMQGSEGWVQVGEDIYGDSARDFSGDSVSMSADGSRVAFGATGLLRSGHLRVFEMQGSEGWIQLGSDIDGDFEQDYFGISVAMSTDGSRVAASSRYHDGYAGQVRVFEIIKECH